jgi:hypothetical protein
MAELNLEYREAEEDILAHELHRENDNKDSALIWLWNRVVKQIRERSLKIDLSSSDYENRLRIAANILQDIQAAISADNAEKDIKPFWRRKTINPLTNSNLNLTELNEIAEKYLANPWMQFNLVDWILIDSMLWAEATKFSREILPKGYQRILDSLMEDKSSCNTLLYALVPFGGWLLKYAIPTAIISLLYAVNYKLAAIITGSPYVIYIAYRLMSWHGRSKERKTQDNLLNIYDRMTKAHHFSAPPIISPIMLRQHINKATNAGALYPGALYVLADRIIKRDRFAFFVYEE